MNKRLASYILLGSLLLASGYWLGHQSPQINPEVISGNTAHQIYVCPMHSHIVQDHPGACPICGMDLVKSDQIDSGVQIHVDTSTQQRFGVRLTTATRKKLTKEINTYATASPDQNSTRRIAPLVMGKIVKLYATYPGQVIRAGAPLYEIYSEELLSLQNEYIDYHRRREQTLKAAEDTRSRNRKMLESMHGENTEQINKGMKQTEEQVESMLLPMERDGERLNAKLKYIGMTDAMLQQIGHSRKAMESVTIHAKQACTVNEVNAKAGMAVSAMTEILSCAETGQAWLELVLYPEQAEYAHEGDVMDITFDDGTQLQTHLTGLSRQTEGASRILKARVPIKLPSGQRLGDYAEVTLHASPREVLAVPASAVIRSGHGNYVIRAMGKGHFMPQPVKIGITSSDEIAILEGLEAGDQIALNGQFLLDASASIAEAAQRFRQP